MGLLQGLVLSNMKCCEGKFNSNRVERELINYPTLRTYFMIEITYCHWFDLRNKFLQHLEPVFMQCHFLFRNVPFSNGSIYSSYLK